MGGAPKTIISMKKTLIAVAMIAATMTANAQQEVGQISLQPKFGISLATLSENENSNSFAQKYGITVGVEAMYQASKNLGVSVGLQYAMQGASVVNQYDSYYSDESNNSQNIKLKYDYINIPLLANLYIAKGLAIKTGVQFGYLVGANKGYNEFEKSYYGSGDRKTSRKSESVIDDCEKFDVSIPVGLSYEISNLVFDARYTYGLTETAKEAFNYAKNRVFSFTVGYKFGL